MQTSNGAYTLRVEKGSEPTFDGFSPLIARILYARGITNSEELDRFLNEPYETGTHDPFLMRDMKKAVERIRKALDTGETIALFSDYDADGIPGAVALSEFLKEIGAENLFVYIPHRGTEGFGMNTTALQEIADKGATLLITIDCGITDVEEVAHARGLGMDVIVTDHHTPLDELPDAHAILNPKQRGCAYPYKDLCGAGVVYKLIKALAEQTPDFSGGREKWYLDLVGIATLADMVPLTGENRVFARYGLLVLRKTRRHGLRALFRAARADIERAVEDDVSFTIAPRVNAASRMAAPQAAFDLLAAQTHEEARENARELESLNRKRKTLVARLVKDAKKAISDGEDSSVIVTGNPQWKPGILGLIASALVDAYNKPAFVWGREPGEDGVLKGSARSDGQIDLVELMKEVPEGVFANFGGHAMSGGFSIELSAVHDLADHLTQAYDTCTVSELRSLQYDADIVPADITRTLFDDLEKLAPYGVGNEKPIFRVCGARVTAVRFFGKEKDHLEVVFESGDGTTSAIGFFMGRNERTQDITEGAVIDILGSLEKSYFGGSLSRRLRIVKL